MCFLVPPIRELAAPVATPPKAMVFGIQFSDSVKAGLMMNFLTAVIGILSFVFERLPLVPAVDYPFRRSALSPDLKVLTESIWNLLYIVKVRSCQDVQSMMSASSSPMNIVAVASVFSPSIEWGALCLDSKVHARACLDSCTWPDTAGALFARLMFTSCRREIDEKVAKLHFHAAYIAALQQIIFNATVPFSRKWSVIRDDQHSKI